MPGTMNNRLANSFDSGFSCWVANVNLKIAASGGAEAWSSKQDRHVEVF